jgi:hypothetical protein
MVLTAERASQILKQQVQEGHDHHSIMRVAAVRLLLAYSIVASALLFVLAAGAGEASAASPVGTWSSRVAGEGYVDRTAPANFHYDVYLEVKSGSSPIKLTCRKVDINWAGWEEARKAVGRIYNYNAATTITGNGCTLVIEGYSFPLKLDGNRLFGSGAYTDSAGTLNTWNYDLTGGGSAALGDMAVASVAGAASAGLGAAAGAAASLAPAPRLVPTRSHPGLQNLAARVPPPPRGPYERWTPREPQIYPNAPPPQGYSAAPGDARPMEPVPFVAPAPDPNLMQPQGGTGITYGPPDTPPPPNPPRGNETLQDNNPGCPRCGARTLPTPTPTVYGYRWHCRSCNWLPWG